MAADHLLGSGYLVVAGAERKIWPPHGSDSELFFRETVANWQRSLRQGMSRKSPHFVVAAEKALQREGRRVAVVGVEEAAVAVLWTSAPGSGLIAEDEQDGTEEGVGEGNLAPDDVTLS
jgi:hypothetical protein